MTSRLRNIVLALTLSLSILLLPACSPKPNVNPTPSQPVSSEQIIAHVKDIGAGLAQALDEGITLEVTLAAQGVIDLALEPQIRQWLKDGKISVDAFNLRLATYTKFDATSKADIVKFAADALALISKLNDEGVLRIKNPRSQLIAAGLIAGARVAVRILKSYADREAALTVLR